MSDFRRWLLSKGPPRLGAVGADSHPRGLGVSDPLSGVGWTGQARGKSSSAVLSHRQPTLVPTRSSPLSKGGVLFPEAHRLPLPPAVPQPRCLSLLQGSGLPLEPLNRWESVAAWSSGAFQGPGHPPALCPSGMDRSLSGGTAQPRSVSVSLARAGRWTRDQEPCTWPLRNLILTRKV